MTRTDIQVLRNLIKAADGWQKKLAGPKWIGTVAAERDLIRDAERVIYTLEQEAAL